MMTVNINIDDKLWKYWEKIGKGKELKSWVFTKRLRFLIEQTN